MENGKMYYYYSKEKARENYVTSCDVTSGYVSDVASGHFPSNDVISGDATSGYILKTSLCHVNKIHTCNTINIVIGQQLFNDDFINDGKCFTTWYQIKNVEMYQRSYSVINGRRSLWGDQQLVKFINIFQPGSRLVR